MNDYQKAIAQADKELAEDKIMMDAFNYAFENDMFTNYINIIKKGAN